MTHKQHHAAHLGAVNPKYSSNYKKKNDMCTLPFQALLYLNPVKLAKVSALT